MIERQETAMHRHINDLKAIQQMVIDKKVDKELEETITETIEGCIVNAKSYLKLEKNNMQKMYNQGGKWAGEIGSEDFFNQNYK